MHFIRSLLLALLVALGAAPALSAQGEAVPAAEAVAAPPGLPQRAAPPRTLRDYWHIFVAFALAWGLLFGYTVSLGRRFARVERALHRLGLD